MRPGFVRRLRPRLTYANVASTLALVIALSGSTAMATIVVSSNSQVAKNTISGHAPPTGDHPNIISGSVNATDLAASYKTSVTVHCPTGMQLGGGLCFETTERARANYEVALATCALSDLRLPTEAEVELVYNNTGAPTGTANFEEWASGLAANGSNFVAPILVENSSRTITEELFNVASALAYRCVTTPTN
jgi:hypothetical protein